MTGMWFGKENFWEFVGESIRSLETAPGRGPEEQRASVGGYDRDK